ncbi:maltose/galactoside acetyltransferase [Penicillium brevicompactum]|uniref:Maltose/galactoside acetyltransferase n=1 Tax=Penicillium brevicompactum TaxID=5074 RepID=A0A9W9R1A2_PENBR|nr:maltose/galactoside acetyltransferase [Penicillium brevicompactum]KAJ5361841.1 maltose/galactoside acetyltransferase [Penicillium brevicompactum]
MAATAKRPEIIELSRDLRGIPQCEDYERMISGMMYNPNTPKLLEARHKCRGLATDYNNLDTKTISYDQVFEKRLELLRKLVGKAGDGTFIEPPFLPDYGCNIIIGSQCFINWNVTILDTSLVVIGDRVQIGTGTSIFTAGHDTSVLSRQKFVEFGHPVFIEDDCWIGGNVIILPGVRIGKGSTIGAGSIVTKDIPDYSVAVGSPCRVKKTIQSPEEEEADPNNPYRNLVRQD